MKFNFDEIILRENTNCYKYDYREKFFGTQDLQPMWVADMDFATPPFITEAVIQRARHPVYGYTFRNKGFYEAISGWMSKRFSWNIDNDWISFSPGVVPAINLCVQCFTNPGDGIIVQSPVYFPFFSAVTHHGRKLLNNQLIEKDNKYQIDFEDFEKKASEASMFIFCHPHNPVGRVWHKAELEQLVNICKKHNVLIISDEIHHDLVLNGNKHIPVGSLNEEASDISICCIAPSKTFNLAGLSTSALIIPNKVLKKKFDKTMEDFHIGMGNIFGITALESAYNYGEEWLEQLLNYIERNLSFLQDFTEQRIPEIRVTPPEATYLVWLDFRGLGMNQKQLRNFATFKAGIGMNDGKTFGLGGEGFQRMNIAVPYIKLEEALHKLEKAIRNIA